MTSRWHESWREGRTAFHQDDVNGDLLAYEEAFLAGGPHRVLVPLCGKTVDLIWLAERGHDAVGVEFVPQAADAFFAEQGLKPETSQDGAIRVLRAGGITILNGDFFAVTQALAGRIDRIWDRAALVALPTDVRIRYAKHIRSLAEPGARLLLNTFEYDESKMDGPPFSIRDSEVREHYSSADIELLSEADVIDKAPRFRERGHDYWTMRNYLITL